MFPCPRACLRIRSRQKGSAVPSRVSLLISLLRLNLVLTYLRDSSRVPRRPPFMKPPYAIGSVPSLSGHAIIAYRWRSLSRVRRHRTGRVNLKVAPNKSSAALAGHHGPINMRLSFPHPLLLLLVRSGYSMLSCHGMSKVCIPVIKCDIDRSPLPCGSVGILKIF